MRIYNDGQYVKNVPQKFRPIQAMIPELITEKRKYLTPDEREKLEKQLLMHFHAIFMDRLKTTDALAWEFLQQGNNQVKELQRVLRANYSKEFRIKFENGKQAWCKRTDFPGCNYVQEYAY